MAIVLQLTIVDRKQSFRKTFVTEHLQMGHLQQATTTDRTQD